MNYKGECPSLKRFQVSCYGEPEDFPAKLRVHPSSHKIRYKEETRGRMQHGGRGRWAPTRLAQHPHSCCPRDTSFISASCSVVFVPTSIPIQLPTLAWRESSRKQSPWYNTFSQVTYVSFPHIPRHRSCPTGTWTVAVTCAHGLTKSLSLPLHYQGTPEVTTAAVKQKS